MAQHQPSQVWYEGDSCVCMDDMNLDFITSRCGLKRSIILDDGRTRESVYSVRLYALHELGKILHDVGFRITEASGHPRCPAFFRPVLPRSSFWRSARSSCFAAYVLTNTSREGRRTRPLRLQRSALVQMK